METLLAIAALIGLAATVPVSVAVDDRWPAADRGFGWRSMLAMMVGLVAFSALFAFATI